MRELKFILIISFLSVLLSCSDSSKNLSPKETVEIALQAYIQGDKLKVQQYMGHLNMSFSNTLFGLLKIKNEQYSITKYYEPKKLKDERILIDLASVELEMKSLFDDSNGELRFYLDNKSGYWKINKIEGLDILIANAKIFEQKKEEEKIRTERILSEKAREKERKIAEEKRKQEIKTKLKTIKSKHTKLFNLFKNLNLSFYTEEYYDQYSDRERSIAEIYYTAELAKKYASIQLRFFCDDWRGKKMSSIYEFELDPEKTKIRSEIRDIDKIDKKCSNIIDIVSYKTRSQKKYSILEEMRRLNDLLPEKDFHKMSMSEILEMKL